MDDLGDDVGVFATIGAKGVEYSRTVAIVSWALYLLSAFYNSDGFPPIHMYFMSILVGVLSAGLAYLTALFFDAVLDWYKE